MALGVTATLAALLLAAPALAHQPGRDARLPTIGPAPAFSLMTSEGDRGGGAAQRGQGGGGPDK